jgi:hypothetical protein
MIRGKDKAGVTSVAATVLSGATPLFIPSLVLYVLPDGRGPGHQ